METAPIILGITQERATRAYDIVKSISTKLPKYKQMWTLAEAYKVFGIQAVYNEHKRSVFLSIGCRDSHNIKDGVVDTGFAMSIKPFDDARDNMMMHVMSFRLGYMDYHRNNPKQFALIER